MNTTSLKKFAQEARVKLIEQVGAKLDYVLNADTAELRENANQLQQLRKELDSTTREQLIDKVAYTWFNRLMALRYMDANDYQPLGIRIITPIEGYFNPEILDEAKRGNIPDDLNIKREKVMDLLDNKIQSANPQNEAYKHLLIAACNHLSGVFPFLFERISDYTELLLPDDLTSDFSIVTDVRNGMLEEDCTKVEVIGWIYQFYISELNEELISSKKKYGKNDLAPASQLFTPKWIVQYMVDNTLGQLWTEINPDTKVTSDLEFYIKPAYKEQLEPRTVKSVEEIKFFEPSSGSGHILSYAFDVFYKIYEEQGYNPSEIPELIITKNLYGIDIDERASQLASFVLLMKGRQKHRRFLRTIERNNIQPNITYYRDFEFDNKFNNASVLGSLIKVEPHEIENLEIDNNSLFGERQTELKKLYQLLGQRYDVVVTNPPYIGSSRMEASLKQYVEANYPETKSDLFATFVLRNLELCNDNGLTGYMTPFVWMFISSYEKLRSNIIEKHFINNLIQLEYSGFDGATVPICTFTLRNKNINDAKGSYIRLSDFKGAKMQAPKTLEAIQNPNCGWFYTANQKDFEKIPASSIGYWLSDKSINIFSESQSLSDIYPVRTGLSTSDSQRFLRFWQEVSKEKSGYALKNSIDAKLSKRKWFPLLKGGEFRRWFGNHDYLLNYQNDGEELKHWLVNNPNDPSTKSWSRYIRSPKFYFKPSLNWTKISSTKFAIRYSPSGFIFSDASNGVFIEESETKIYSYLAYLNSKLATVFLSVISPTLNFKSGDIAKLPVLTNKDAEISISELSEDCARLMKKDWNTREISWDFQRNELIRINGQNLSETYDLYQQYWKNKFNQLHQNEEELNRQFIDIYGLQDELTPDVPLKDITILKEETKIINGELVFQAKEVFAQFISYAVGCMFGRYSLDKEGLVLANQGETLSDYMDKVQSSKFNVQNIEDLSFVPDNDNIIPILDEEWFEDDIVGRFNAFLKASFGAENFQKNLYFVEEQIGMDIRKYFTKSFYKDHIKRYKKRPIYWMFSSPKGSFNVLIYMHRYTPDTLHHILNKYLREYSEKLKNRKEHLQQLMVSGTASQKTSAIKENDKLDKVLMELQDYERDVLYPLATERIAIDLDHGVLVNYNKFANAIKEVPGLNDKKAKAKVRKFDWIDVEEIRG